MRALFAGLSVVLLIACTNSTPTAARSHSPLATAGTTSSAPTDLCFAGPPGDWVDAMTNLTASFDGLNFSAGAVDDRDGIVFGGVFTAARTYIAAINLATGKLT